MKTQPSAEFAAAPISNLMSWPCADPGKATQGGVVKQSPAAAEPEFHAVSPWRHFCTARDFATQATP